METKFSNLSKPIPVCDQETSISYLRSEEEAYIYSSIPSEAKRLVSLSQQYPEEYTIISIELYNQQPASVTVKASKKLITIRKPRKPTQLTPEQIQKRKEHGRKLASLRKEKK